MTRRFKFSLGDVFWFVLVAGANLVTWRAALQNLPRREMLGCGCIAITVPRDGKTFSDDDGMPKLPEPPVADSFEWREPEWQPIRLTYLNDDGTVTVETISPKRGND